MSRQILKTQATLTDIYCHEFEKYIFEITILRGLEILFVCKRSLGEVRKSYYSFPLLKLVKEKIFSETGNFFHQFAID